MSISDIRLPSEIGAESLQLDPCFRTNPQEELAFTIGNQHVVVELAEQDLNLVDCEQGLRLPEGQVTGVYAGLESGQCGGVKATLLGVEALQGVHETPVFVNATPTNGADSNERFRRAGVRMSVPLEEIHEGDVAYVSAHGNPSFLRRARELGATVYDGTCIFVDKTHREVESVAEDAEREGSPMGIIYLSLEGRDSHPELVGTRTHAEELGLGVVVIKTPEDIENLLHPDSPAAEWTAARIVSQTTNDAVIAERVAGEIRRKIVDSDLGVDMSRYDYNSDDVCRTVSDRQEAVRIMVAAKGIETLVVVGSLFSKNTMNLIKVAKMTAQEASRTGLPIGLKRIVLVNSHGQLPEDLEGLVGVASGASTEDANVDAVVKFMNAGEPEMIGESDKVRLGRTVFPPVKRTGESTNQHLLAELIERAAETE